MTDIRAIACAAALALVLAGSTACKRNSAASQQAAQSSAGQQATASGTNDGTVTTAVLAKFYRTPAIKQSDIDVRSKNGVVTLNGSVPNDQAKQQAVDAARQVPGVQRVEDELSVQQGGQAAANGSGGQAGADAGEQAGTSAPGTPGGGQNGQVAQSGAGAPNAAAGAKEQLRDGSITVRVQSEYFGNPDVKGRDVDVDTANGVVTLNGTVDSDKAHQEAVQIARNTDGVKQVVDRLRVVSPNRPTATSGTEGAAPPAGGNASAGLPDNELTTRIQSKFYSDDLLRPSDVDVKTDDGVVTLAGTVASEAQRDQAVAVARSTYGVQRVDDRIRVEAPPHVGTIPQLPASQSQVPDDLLKAEVQSKYFLNDTLKKNDITVAAQSGVVTLTGTVDSQDARREAEDLARSTEGVSRVVDNLTVANGEQGSR